MDLYTVFVLLLVVSALFSYVNHRFLRLPSTIGLMVLALVTSLVLVLLGKLGFEGVLHIRELVNSIDFHTLLIQVMLSFLLFAGAIHVNTNALGKQRVPVATLASIGILLSTLLVGVGVYWLLTLFDSPVPFVYCLLFGALISPTDPIAVLGILKEARIPKNLEVNIVGESLLNDGVALVIFVSLFDIAQAGWDKLDWSTIALLFLREVLGGISLGVALGYICHRLMRSIDDYKVEVLLTLALVMGGTALAVALHTSGPLAIVVAGLIIGQHSRSSATSEATRRYLDGFWEILDDILNGILFVLIGLEILVIKISALQWLIGLVTIGVVLMARLLSVALPLGVLRFRHAFPKHSVKILTWGGLRGGISVALALSLPESDDRDLIVSITYVVVLFSILVQGLTIGSLVKYLGLSQPVADPAEKAH